MVDKKRYLITMVSNCKADDSYRLSDNNRNGQSFWNEVQKYVDEGNVIDTEGFKLLSVVQRKVLLFLLVVIMAVGIVCLSLKLRLLRR